MGLEIVRARLPAKVRRASAIVSHVLMLYGLWLFVKGGWGWSLIGTETFSTVLRCPLALPAGAARWR